MFIDMKAQCFMEAARCLNFTRAAEKLYISQPALSKNIAALEAECGMKLFYRDHRRNQVKLTPAGSVMLCEFQKMESILGGVIDKARRAEAGQEGHLTIGLPTGQIISDIAAKVFQTISEKYPKIEINKVQGEFHDLNSWLEDGTVDMIMAFEEVASQMQDVLFEEVGEVQLGFGVPTSYPLAKKRTLKLEDLQGQKVVIPSESEAPVYAQRFRDACKEKGVIPKEYVAPDLRQVNMMGELGNGIIITREDCIVTRSPNLKFFKNSCLGTVKLAAVWRKDNLNPIITFYHQMYEDMYHMQKEEK